MIIRPEIEVPETCETADCKCLYNRDMLEDMHDIELEESYCDLFRAIIQDGNPCQQCIDERMFEIERKRLA